MDRLRGWLPVHLLLAVLAAASLAWGAAKALNDSADLLRRAQEVDLLARGQNPYSDPDLTYPPSALPVFAALVAPVGSLAVLKAFWLGINIAALAAVCGALVRLWTRDWSTGLKLAVCLAIIACKPVRGGIGLGQFHLIPLALVLWSLVALEVRRPVLAGLLMGLALAKPTMAVPFLAFFAARRQGKALAAALAVPAFCWLGVAAWLRTSPLSLAADWLAVARSQRDQGVLDLPSLLARAFPLAPWNPLVLAMLLLVLAVVLTLVLRRRSDLALVSFCGLVSAIFTYHRHYDYVLLLPAFVHLVETGRQASGGWAWPARAAAVGFAAVLIAPSNALVTGRLEPYYDALLILAVYGELALAVVLLWRPALWRQRA